MKDLVQIGASGFLGYVKPDFGGTFGRGRQGPRVGSVSITKEKTSIDTGHFVPGRYRINPYTVSNGYTNIREGIGAQSAENWPAGTPYKSSYVTSETVGLNHYYAPFQGGALVFAFGEWWRYGLLNSADILLPPRVAATYEQLSLQKGYAKLGKADLALGESIGELRETINMLRNPLANLRKFLISDKSRNLRLLFALAKGNKAEILKLGGRTVGQGLTAASSTWLELRYGLRPLVMLIQDVIDRIQKQRETILDPDLIRSVRSKLVFGPYENWVDAKVYYGDSAELRARVWVEDTYVSTSSVQYRQAGEQGNLDALGLTPRFLPEVAWELTKLSFVVDWLYSIGPWLATLRINPGITTLGNTSGFKHQRRMKIVNVRAAMPFAFDYEVFMRHVLEAPVKGPVVPDVVYSKYVRKVNLDLSYLPHFTWGRTLDLFKAIDTASLIWQFLPKR